MISTHVLDTARGVPAAGVPVLLERLESSVIEEVSRAETDGDGRVRELVSTGTAPGAGRYRLTFDTEPYFSALGVEVFYPSVAVVFDVRDGTQHHHVPLLLSPYGYSTYRGS
jgi:5-hydroxyisourate hydrolase